MLFLQKTLYQGSQLLLVSWDTDLTIRQLYGRAAQGKKAAPRPLKATGVRTTHTLSRLVLDCPTPWSYIYGLVLFVFSEAISRYLQGISSASIVLLTVDFGVAYSLDTP